MPCELSKQKGRQYESIDDAGGIDGSIGGDAAPNRRWGSGGGGGCGSGIKHGVKCDIKRGFGRTHDSERNEDEPCVGSELGVRGECGEPVVAERFIVAKRVV
jgi:hypothetical protein